MNKVKLSKNLSMYLLASTLALGSTMPIQNLETTFQNLEKEYTALQNKEAAYYAGKEKAALVAQEKLNKQKVLYEDIAKKEAQLEKIKEVRFYKEQYANLANKFGQIKQEVAKQMNEQKRVINEYLKLKKIKEGK